MNPNIIYLLQAVREAGGIVTTLPDYLDELEEWSKAKEIAQFLIRSAAPAPAPSSCLALAAAASLALLLRSAS